MRKKLQSSKSLHNAITHNQLLARLEAPPQIAHALVQPGGKDGVDVAEHALVVLEPQLAAQEAHDGLEALRARALEARVAQGRGVGQRREADGHF